jgi:hypothetical protein
MELPIKKIRRDGIVGSFASVDRQSAPSGACTQCLPAHQSLDAMQSTAMTGFQHVTPDPAGAVRAITIDKTQTGLLTDNLIVQAASTPWPR